MTYTENKKQQRETVKKVIAKKEVKVVTEILKEEEAVYLVKETHETRYLKIQPFHKPSTGKNKPYKIMPDIRLCGLWLTEAGFVHDSFVTVTVMDGLLIIRPASIDDSPKWKVVQ